MKISIDWGKENRIAVEAAACELPQAASCIVELVEKHLSDNREDCASFSVEDTETMRALFDNYLSNMKFKRVELRDVEKVLVGTLLMYRQKGWSYGN